MQDERLAALKFLAVDCGSLGPLSIASWRPSFWFLTLQRSKLPMHCQFKQTNNTINTPHHQAPFQSAHG